MAGGDPPKSWERPWTTDEMRQQSTDWNLAGDAGLLNHLKQFSQTLLTRTHSTQTELNGIMDNLESSTIDINNITNTFLALANTQFVENRVYDDDEKETPPEEKQETPKVLTKEEQEAATVVKVGEALALGMSVIDKFEAIEVSASDSEDEESARVVYRPVDPYASRKLPFLIGSKEFFQDDDVGLGDTQSDNEDSSEQNLAQPSDSESEADKDNFAAPSRRSHISALSSSGSENSEPESERGMPSTVKEKKLRPDAVPTEILEEPEGDMFGRESPPEAQIDHDELAAPKVVAPASFAEELAAKLGGVAAKGVPTKAKHSAPATAKQPRERLPTKSDNLFSPPSDSEEDDSLFGPSAGKFSGSGGLFDDLRESPETSDSLWGETKTAVNKKATDEKPPVTDHTAEKKPTSAQPSLFASGSTTGDLFSSVADDNDDDIFSSISKKSPGVAFQETLSTSLSKDKERELFADIPESSGLFGNSGLPAASGVKSAAVSPAQAKEEPPEAVKKKMPGARSMFGPNFAPGKASSVVRRPLSSSDSEGEEKATAATQDQDTDKAGSLFGSDGEDTLFKPTLSAPRPTIDIIQSPRQDEEGQPTQLPSSRSSGGAVKSSASKKPVSLFDTSDSGEDELFFSSTSSASSRSRRSQVSADLLASNIEKNPLNKRSLFENEDKLFGDISQDEPGFNIFSSGNTSTKTVSEPSLKETDNTKTDTLRQTDKTKLNGLFSDDTVNDLFAVPSKDGQPSLLSSKPSLSISLFSDELDDTVDIFSVGNSKPNQGNKFADPSNKLPIEGEQSKSTDIFSDAISYNKPPSTISKKSVNLFEGLDDENGDFLFGDSELKKEEPVSEVREHLNEKPALSEKPKSVFEKVASHSQPSSQKLVVSEKPKTVSKESYEPSTQKPVLSEKLASASVEQALSEDIFSVTQSKEYFSDDTIVVEGSGEVSRKESEHTEISRTETVVKVTEKPEKDEPFTSNKAVKPAVATKPEPPKTLNIRKTTELLLNTSSNDDDLFSSSWATNITQQVPAAKPSNITRDRSESSTVQPDLAEVDGGIVSQSRAAGGGDMSKPSAASQVSPSALNPKGRSPRFNIDPTALLPGAKPPSRNLNTESAVSFDKPADANSTLRSAAKERAKIQAKRQPPSRRARHEALRVSAVGSDEFDGASVMPTPSDNQQLVTDPGPHKTVTVAPPLANKPDFLSTAESANIEERLAGNFNGEKLPDLSNIGNISAGPPKPLNAHLFTAGSNPLSPSTDEEDLFGVPHDFPSEYGNLKDQATVDGSDLFGGAPVLSPVGLPVASVLLGGNSPTAEDLFPTSSDQQRDAFVDSAAAAEKNSDNSKEDLFVPSQNFGSTEVTKTLVESFPNSGRNVESDSDSLFESTTHIIDNSSLFASVKDLPKQNLGRLFTDNIPVSSEKYERRLFFPDTKIDTVNNEGMFTPSVKQDTRQDNVVLNTDESDDLFTSNITSTRILPKSYVPESLFGQATSKPNSVLLTEDDEDDLFSRGSKTLTRSMKVNENVLVSSEGTKSNDFIEGDYITRTASTVSKRDQVAPSASVSLFGEDSPESEDLFSSTLISSKKTASSAGLLPPSDPHGRASSKLIEKSISSLFDDDDSDDIFAASAITGKASAGQTGVKKTQPKIKKLITPDSSKDPSDLFEDPLMALKK